MPLGLGLTGINSKTNTKAAIGGMARYILIPKDDVDIDSSTLAAGNLVTVAITNAEQALYVPKKDTATLTSTGALEDGSHRSNIEGLAEFPGIRKEDIAEASRLTKVKDWIIIAEMNNCLVVLFGWDVVEGCSANEELKDSLTELRPVVSLDFGTSGGTDKLTMNFNGTQRTPACVIDTATQTFDDILALTAP